MRIDSTALDMMAQRVEGLLIELGYLSDLGEGDISTDENFVGTPLRMARWLASFQKIDVEQEIADVLSPIFPEEHSELVIVKDIAFVALCAHHMLPFFGKAHVGYIPKPSKGVVGISKLARAVKIAAHQLTLQERITRQVADTMYRVLDCEGVMVVLTDVHHACMSFRGIEDEHARTTTSAVRGIFETNKDGCKDEALALMIGK